MKIIFNALGENNTVTDFAALYNEITDDSSAAIAEMLRKNSRLTKLNIGANKITAVGMRVIAAALPANLALTRLDVVGNPLDPEEQYILVESGRNMTLSLADDDGAIRSAAIRQRVSALREHAGIPSVCVGVVTDYLGPKYRALFASAATEAKETTNASPESLSFPPTPPATPKPGL
jgi:hypothetical protein